MSRSYFLEDPMHPNGGIEIKCSDEDCVFCKYCADFFWDYSNLIYMIICEKGHNPWNRPCILFKEKEGEKE